MSSHKHTRHNQYHQSSGELKLQRNITCTVTMPLEPTAKRARPPGNKCWCDHGGKEHLNTIGGNLSQDDRWPYENRTTVGSSHHTSRYMSKGNELCNPQTYLSVHVSCEATHHNRGCNHLRPSPTRTRRNEGYIDSRILLSCKDE